MTLSRSRAAADGGRTPAVAAREQLLAEHATTLSAVIGVADEVAAGRDGRRESAAVRETLSTALSAADLERPLLAALDDAVAAIGESLPHEPVPEPPYLAVTGRGPVLRATPAAGRLVVVVGVFAVERTPEVRYVRTGDTPAAVLRVEFHGEETTVVAPGGRE